MPHPTYSAAHMNNTKWREVLTLIAQFQLEFEVAYVGSERFQYGSVLSTNLLTETYIADPGIAEGPSEYKDIYAIRIPKTIMLRNAKTGVKIPSSEKSDLFQRAAAQLGAIPIKTKEDFIYLYGYSHRNL